MGCSCWAVRCAIRTVNVEHGPSKRLDHLFRPAVVFPAEAGDRNPLVYFPEQAQPLGWKLCSDLLHGGLQRLVQRRALERPQSPFVK